MDWSAARTTPSPPSGGVPPKLTAAHEQRLIDAVKNQPDATLAQSRQACGAPVTCAAIGQHLQKLKLGRKKWPAIIWGIS